MAQVLAHRFRRGQPRKGRPAVGASSCGCGWWLRHQPLGTRSFHSAGWGWRATGEGVPNLVVVVTRWLALAGYGPPCCFALPSLLQQKAFTLLALVFSCAVALASSVMAHPDHQQATQQGNPAAQHDHEHSEGHAPH